MPLRRTKDLGEYTVAAFDTDIGTVNDFYFDDEHWIIRYIVIATGVILSGRKVLISPLSLRHPAWSSLHIHANLTWEQVDSSPGIDLHKPVSRRHEAEHHKHYGLPHYWEGQDVPSAMPQVEPKTKEEIAASEDSHLRSIQEVAGYHIKATDGDIGHLEDFLFDDETWEIRYAIIDTKNWWPGKKVLLSPQWIKRVSWADREIYVNMSRQTIRTSPEWDPDQPVNRAYELQLHQHYGYAPYWTVEK